MRRRGPSPAPRGSAPAGPARRPAAAAKLGWPLASREDGDTVMRALAVPKRAVARVLEHARRTFLVGSLDLLEADNVGARLLEPLEQPRKAAIDAVDVVGRDLQAA